MAQSTEARGRRPSKDYDRSYLEAVPTDLWIIHTLGHALKTAGMEARVPPLPQGSLNNPMHFEPLSFVREVDGTSSEGDTDVLKLFRGVLTVARKQREVSQDFLTPFELVEKLEPAIEFTAAAWALVQNEGVDSYEAIWSLGNEDRRTQLRVKDEDPVVVVNRMWQNSYFAEHVFLQMGGRE